MSDLYQQRAEKVVADFMERLNTPARGAISDAQFQELALMIREAMAETLKDATDQMDEVVRALRTGLEKPDLGL